MALATERPMLAANICCHLCRVLCGVTLDSWCAQLLLEIVGVAASV